MSFRYINPGYGALIDSSVTTLESFVYNPTNGVAFNKSIPVYDTELKIPLPQSFTKDIYGKFNLYFDTSYQYLDKFRLGTISSRNDYVGVYLESAKMYLRNGWVNRGSGIGLKTNALNSIWFHVNLNSSTECSGKLIVNEKEETIENASNGAIFSKENNYFQIRFPRSDGSYYGDKMYISDLIISDEYISPKEKIIILPASTTETDMTEEDGLYSASAAGQTLLQSVDATELIENFGADSALTGIALVGNPAYKTAEGLSSLISLSKENELITERDSCSLSQDTQSVIGSFWSLENKTIADLKNMKFGWKAGE